MISVWGSNRETTFSWAGTFSPCRTRRFRLVDYPGGEFDVALQILLKAQGQKGLLGSEQGSSLDLVEEGFPIADRLPGDLEKILVCPLFLPSGSWRFEPPTSFSWPCGCGP